METAHRPERAGVWNGLAGKHLHNATCADLADVHLFVPRVLLMRFITVRDKEGQAGTLHMHLFTPIYDARGVTAKMKSCSWSGLQIVHNLTAWQDEERLSQRSACKVSTQDHGKVSQHPGRQTHPDPRSSRVPPAWRNFCTFGWHQMRTLSSLPGLNQKSSRWREVL